VEDSVYLAIGMPSPLKSPTPTTSQISQLFSTAYVPLVVTLCHTVRTQSSTPIRSGKANMHHAYLPFLDLGLLSIGIVIFMAQGHPPHNLFLHRYNSFKVRHGINGENCLTFCWLDCWLLLCRLRRRGRRAWFFGL
jgi:hypothetical protein